jgi:hypothetical protein
MKSRSHLSVYVMIAVGIILLAACAPNQTAAPQKIVINADTARWVAIGESYTALADNRLAVTTAAAADRKFFMDNYLGWRGNDLPAQVSPADCTSFFTGSAYPTGH